jgi:hypothetical protein
MQAGTPSEGIPSVNIFLPAAISGESPGGAGNRGLGSKVGGDGGIAQSCGHAPHIGLRVRIGARLVAKGLELGDDIILLLAARRGKVEEVLRPPGP